MVEHADRVGQRERDLLHRRRSGFLQVVRAHVDGVPLRDLADAPRDEVGGQPHRVLRREHVRPPRQELLQDVVLRGPGELRARGALFVRDDHEERHEPHGRRVDRHRGVHPRERDVLEDRPQVTEVRDGDAHAADLAARHRRIAVVPRLGWQVERDGQARLALLQVRPETLVRPTRRRVAGVRSVDQGLVASTLDAHGRQQTEFRYGKGSMAVPTTLTP